MKDTYSELNVALVEASVRIAALEAENAALREALGRTQHELRLIHRDPQIPDYFKDKKLLEQIDAALRTAGAAGK